MRSLDRLLYRGEKPWTDERSHPCPGRVSKTFLLSPLPLKKVMVVRCATCNKKWPHPGGDELFSAFLAGYRTARQHVNVAADQMLVAIVGVQA